MGKIVTSIMELVYFANFDIGSFRKKDRVIYIIAGVFGLLLAVAEFGVGLGATVARKQAGIKNTLLQKALATLASLCLVGCFMGIIYVPTLLIPLSRVGWTLDNVAPVPFPDGVRHLLYCYYIIMVVNTLLASCCSSGGYRD